MTRAATYDELTAKLREAREEAAAFRAIVWTLADSDPWQPSADYIKIELECHYCGVDEGTKHDAGCLRERARELVYP
jgi:hypothetical protein